MKLDLVGPGYLGRSPNINASRCVNLYPELSSPDSKTVAALVGTPGLLLYIDTLLGPIRGIHFFNNLIYFISGNKLYSVDAAKNIFPIVDVSTGDQVALATASGFVSMADNGMYSVGGAVANQLAFVDGINIYVVNVSTGVFYSTHIPAKTIDFIGGYFMADMGGAKFGISDLYDGTSWPGLAFSIADAYPDNLFAIANHHNEAWVIGEESTEIWVADGSGNPFPFSRSSVIDFGTSAPYSVAKGSNSLFFLANKKTGDTGTVLGIGMATGYTVEIVSSPAINYMLSKFTVISDAKGYCYADRGHEFYVLTFPTENSTVVFDSTTRLMHERSYYQGSPYAIGRHLSNCYVYAWGKHYAGSYIDGKIYEMSENYYDDDGTPLVSVRTCSPISDKNTHNKFIVNKFELDMEFGVGDLTASTPVGIVLKSYTATGALRMANDGKCIWYIDGSNLYKFAPATGTTSSTLLSGSLGDVAFHRGNIYVSNVALVGGMITGLVYKIDTTTNVVVDIITVAAMSSIGVMASDGAFLWVFGTGYLYKIDTLANTVVATINMSSVLSNDMVFGLGYLWITFYSAGTVKKIDVTSNTVVAAISVGTHPYGIACDLANPWVVSTVGGIKSVSKIDPATNTVSASIAISTTPVYLAFDNKYMCVSNYTPSSANIKRIDSATNSVHSTITLNINSYANKMMFFKNEMWVICGSKLMQVQMWQDSPTINPKVLLSWSEDGGHTFSNDHQLGMGKMGEYKRRGIIRRIGMFRDWIPRIAVSDAVKRIFTNAYIETQDAQH